MSTSSFHTDTSGLQWAEILTESDYCSHEAWAAGGSSTCVLVCSIWSDLVQVELIGEQCQVIVAERSRRGQDPGLIQSVPRTLFRISDLWAQGPGHHLVGASKSVKPLKQVPGPFKAWRKLRLFLGGRTLSPRWSKSTDFPKYIQPGLRPLCGSPGKQLGQT